MKLITETLHEFKTSIVEGANGKEYFIEGIFLQANKVNRNGRYYPQTVMDKAVGKYIKEYVETGRAIGELNHPPTIEINPERASHKIVELNKVGNDYIGKALVLDTPCGKIVKALLDGGVQLGVSSRGLGSIKHLQGKKMVGEDFVLKTVDIVQDPSAQDAFVNGIYEGVEYEYENGKLIEKKSEFETDILSENATEDLFLSKLDKFIKNL